MNLKQTFLVLTILLFAGCGVETRSFSGRFVTDAGTSWEFHRDGRAVYGPDGFTRTWSRDGNTIEIFPPVSSVFATARWELSVDGSLLYETFDDRTVTYKRVSE